MRSIIALCHGLGLQVIAEGVERAPQLEFLAGCGPVGVQGYLLAYPVEAASAASEAQAASARARLSLEAGSRVPRHEGVESLVFVGGTRRRTPRIAARRRRGRRPGPPRQYRPGR